MESVRCHRSAVWATQYHVCSAPLCCVAAAEEHVSPNFGSKTSTWLNTMRGKNKNMCAVWTDPLKKHVNILRSLHWRSLSCLSATHMYKLSVDFPENPRGECVWLWKRKKGEWEGKGSVYSAKELFTFWWEEDGHPQLICAGQWAASGPEGDCWSLRSPLEKLHREAQPPPETLRNKDLIKAHSSQRHCHGNKREGYRLHYTYIYNRMAAIDLADGLIRIIGW